MAVIFLDTYLGSNINLSKTERRDSELRQFVEKAYIKNE